MDYRSRTAKACYGRADSRLRFEKGRNGRSPYIRTPNQDYRAKKGRAGLTSGGRSVRASPATTNIRFPSPRVYILRGRNRRARKGLGSTVGSRNDEPLLMVYPKSRLLHLLPKCMGNAEEIRPTMRMTALGGDPAACLRPRMRQNAPKGASCAAVGGPK
jgi:hypothetical protein